MDHGIPIENMSPTNTVTYVIFGTILVVLIPGMALFVFLIYVKRRRFARILLSTLSKEEILEFMNGNSGKDDTEYDSSYTPSMKLPYNRSLEIPRENLEIEHDQILGIGQFGCVFKARISKDASAVNVALKTTKEDCPPTALKGLLSEIKILSYLGKHPNIVSILGAYTAELENGIVYIAMELCPVGCLKKMLGKLRKEVENKNKLHTQSDLYSWSFDIACGMGYLEKKGVIHADLATRNVLLTEEKTAKITDFGLSRRPYEYEKYTKKTREALPWRWMAVESMKRMEFSTKSDVWSYGVTLWEIFSLGSQPFPMDSWSTDFIAKLENGVRLRKPTYATDQMYHIMTNCWNLSPTARPPFTELKALTRNLISTEIYCDFI